MWLFPLFVKSPPECVWHDPRERAARIHKKGVGVNPGSHHNDVIRPKRRNVYVEGAAKAVRLSRAPQGVGEGADLSHR